MKYKKTIQIPATTREIIEAVSCDLCGNKIENRGYETDAVVVTHRSGVNYPDSGWGEETELDVCGKCFTEKLLPWAISQGAVPTVTEWEY